MPVDEIERRLLILAIGFLGLFSSTLTLSPAARARSWDVNYRWDHWIGFAIWSVIVVILHRSSTRYLPNRDPYLFPVAALLSGWGLLTIWRLYPSYGTRQTLWLMVCAVVFLWGSRQENLLTWLRRFKYLWLSGGLVLTALTLVLGTNPGVDSGPRLWLGCCGVYFQPSEPLKLLLIIYLSAYLADFASSLNSNEQQVWMGRSRAVSLLPFLAPTLFMTGLALLILFAQRDLGTVSIFVLLYAFVVYVAIGKVQILLANAVLLVTAGWLGYHFFDVVRLRMEAWLNPWLDPSGRSYHIVQSLLAIANGGWLGRGPGMGSPTLVPISHSDSIFAAIAEESGLVGVIALLILFALIINRGLHIAVRAEDHFRYYLSCGLIVYLVIQSILIIGGNIRLLPLTGVTLPYVSYGGTSLLTAWLALLLLLHISNNEEARPPLKVNIRPLLHICFFLMGALVSIACVTGWWGLYRGSDLLGRTDNARRSIAERYVRRGDIHDRRDTPIVATQGNPGAYVRVYLYPSLGPITGYNHPIYGQNGLEATLDAYLRGVEGYSDWAVAWNHLLYGEPPQGLDVRLSLDLNLQSQADQLLGDHTGALVMIHSQSGEVLAMASHPPFDPNQLDREWSSLVEDVHSPLVNRVTQGLYQPGAALGVFFLENALELGEVPNLPSHLSLEIDGIKLACAMGVEEPDWGSAIAAGCPAPQLLLGKSLGEERVLDLFHKLGWFEPPKLPLPSESISPLWSLRDSEWAYLGLSVSQAEPGQALSVSPMQMVLAAATLNNEGVRPAPRLAIAVRRPNADWVFLPSSGNPTTVFHSEAARSAVEALALQDLPIWQSIAVLPDLSRGQITWYLGGTLPSWQGAPLTLVVVLEEGDGKLAESIGQSMLAATMQLSSAP